jgi:hypothetical protein
MPLPQVPGLLSFSEQAGTLLLPSCAKKENFDEETDIGAVLFLWLSTGGRKSK